MTPATFATCVDSDMTVVLRSRTDFHCVCVTTGPEGHVQEKYMYCRALKDQVGGARSA